MAKHWLKNLSHRAAHVKMLQPVYGMSLGSLESLLEFETTPADLFGGDAGRGRWIANGQMDISGHRVPLDFDTWYLGTNYEYTPFFDKLHGFDFLIELKSLGGSVGRQSARSITQAWLESYRNYHHVLWRPDITASRLVNWMIAYDFAFVSAPDDFLDLFHECFYRQYHHLKNVVSLQNEDDLFIKYAALWGLIIIQCHCEQLHNDVEFQSYLQLMKGVLGDISYEDGGLIDRNPQNLIDTSRSLLQLRQSLQQKSGSVPLWLSKKIEQVTRALNLLTHTDKDLPQFQGAILPNKVAIEKITKLSNMRYRRNDTQFVESGYTSMRKGRTSVLVDHDEGDSLSPLAFEMGHGAHRIIVSCGSYFMDEQWAQSLSGVGAYSCLMIDGVEPKSSMLNIKTSLESLNGASLFSGTHEGYAKDYGLNHTRRLYLDTEGYDFRGEDVLVRNIAIKPLSYTIRFHLHPTVKASLIDDKKGVLIKLPTGAGWMFHVNQGDISLQESVYCSDGYNLRKSEQIVVDGQLGDLSTQVKWALKRH